MQEAACIYTTRARHVACPLLTACGKKVEKREDYGVDHTKLPVLLMQGVIDGSIRSSIHLKNFQDTRVYYAVSFVRRAHTI